MSRLVARRDQDVTVFTVQGPDGAAQWPFWAVEQVTPLVVSPPREVALFSFSSGRILARGECADPDVGNGPSITLCGDLPAAAQIESALLHADPIDRTGDFHRGIIHQTRGEFDAARQAFEAAIAAEPKLWRVHNLLGLCRRLSGDQTGAEDAYHQEIDRNPGSPDAHCNLGVLYLKTDRQHLARTQFEKALDRDPFYLNALVQLTRLARTQEGAQSPLIPPLAWRLFVLFSDLPAIRQHLDDLARDAQMPLDQYRSQCEGRAGLLRDPQLLTTMRRIEQLRHNGCLVQVWRGLDFLMAQTRTNPALSAMLTDWSARRMAAVNSLPVPPAIASTCTEIRTAVLARWPALATVSPSGPALPTAALTAEQFFALALEEIFRDGQVTREETQLIMRLKNALRIDSETHQRLFNETASRYAGNTLADDGGDFDAQRLFRTLVLAVARDQRLDPGEKRLLDIACEALEILPEVREQVLTAVLGADPAGRPRNP